MAIVPETVLKACPIFKGFTDTGIAIFASIAVPRAFPKGTQLFAEGKKGESLLIVGEGTVRLSAKNQAGRGDLTRGRRLSESPWESWRSCRLATGCAPPPP